MAEHDNDERPKRSWRDIDKMRDRSPQRRDERSGAGSSSKMQQSAAYKSYKTQLNKLFSGGALPDALKSKLVGAGIGDEVKRRKAAATAILAAENREAMLVSLETYRAAHGFPDDEEVLAKLIDLGDETLAREALETIARLQAQGPLKRGASLKARIKTVQMTLDDPEVQELAAAVLAKL